MKRMMTLTGLATLSLVLGTTANAANISLGKTYSYTGVIPGQTAGVGPHYLDSGHSTTEGVFTTGELTDGLVTVDGSEGSTGSNPYVAFHGSAGSLPAVDIVIDLEAEYIIDDVVIGHGTRGCCGMAAPDAVTISFSSTSATSGYSAGTNFALWGTPVQSPGHHEMTLAATSLSARWVKISFAGGDFGNNDKYVLDEITVNGEPVPEPDSLALLGLGGLFILCRRRG